MKLGLFGGAFDPVHIGHTDLAKRIYSCFHLDKIIFIPSKIPPHKTFHKANGLERFNMLKLALKDFNGNYEVSDFEIESDNISYTYDTLKYFNKIYKGWEIYFITGSDIFATIKKWKNWNKLFNLAKFIVVKRAGVTFDNMRDQIGVGIPKMSFSSCYHGKNEENGVILFDADIPDVSSTFIRKNIEKAKGLVSESVLDYIKVNKLYKEG